MEMSIDETARRFDRANAGIRALRVHLFLVAMGLLAQFAGAAGLSLYQTFAEEEIDLAWLSSLTGQEYGGVYWVLVVALLAAAVLIGRGLDEVVATGARTGMLRILLGVFLVVWFILGQFLFYPSSWGLIGNSGNWPIRFGLVYWGGLAIYAVVLVYAAYGILGGNVPADVENRDGRRCGFHGYAASAIGSIGAPASGSRCLLSAALRIGSCL